MPLTPRSLRNFHVKIKKFAISYNSFVYRTELTLGRYFESFGIMKLILFEHISLSLKREDEKKHTLFFSIIKILQISFLLEIVTVITWKKVWFVANWRNRQD